MGITRVPRAADNCADFNILSTYCYDVKNDERPRIYLKSAFIFFFVNKDFTLKDVELHGGDLMKAFDSTIRDKYSSYCDDSTNPGQIIQTSCQPSKKGWFYMDPIDPSTATPKYYKKSVKLPRPNGLFTLQFIRDVASPVVPKLLIQVNRPNLA